MRVAAFDEMHGPGMNPGTVRPPYASLERWLRESPRDLLETRLSQAELFFRRIGITFAPWSTRLRSS